MGPGQKIETFLVSVIERQDLFKRGPFNIIVDYMDLDFKQWANLTQLKPPPLFEIAKSTEGIQKNLDKFMDSRNPPIVLTGAISEHRLLGSEKVLLRRMRYLPVEVQKELLQELSVAICHKERENPKANRASYFEKLMSRSNT